MTFFIKKTRKFVLALAFLASMAAVAVSFDGNETDAERSREGNNKVWLKGIFRVNTDVSAGDESLDVVCGKAESANIDFIVVTDQFLVRAEYGIWPFRKALSYSLERKSVKTFGIERYLSLIDETDSKHPSLALIPGVDVAPHYFWSGFPFSKNFSIRRFSEQLTVFGPSDPAFYRGIPVIHNTVREAFWRSIVKLLPLFLTLWGLFLCFNIKTDEYRDASGKLLSSWINRPRLLLALSLIVCGVVWTIDNHPFSRELGFSQYADAGTAPFQKVIDYVESRKNATAGIIWSAPEAEMRCVENGVALTTLPYLSDVKGTFGHNGMAGLYGDAVTALRPGGEWDSMLKEYCDGVRRTRPIIVGELDYHGRKRRIDMYQTVVRNSGKNRRSIFDAIVAGRSYAYAKPAGYGMELTSASLKSGSETAGLGDVLNISDERLPLVAALSLKISGSAPKGLSGRLKIIVNGIIVAQKMFSDKDVRFEFPLEQLIESWKSGKPGYVRFDVAYGSARIATNPIFIRHGGNGKEKMTAWKDRPTF